MTLETVCENLGDFYFLQEYLKNAYSSMRNWFKWNQVLLFYKLKTIKHLDFANCRVTNFGSFSAVNNINCWYLYNFPSLPRPMNLFGQIISRILYLDLVFLNTIHSMAIKQFNLRRNYLVKHVCPSSLSIKALTLCIFLDGVTNPNLSGTDLQKKCKWCRNSSTWPAGLPTTWPLSAFSALSLIHVPYATLSFTNI